MEEMDEEKDMNRQMVRGMQGPGGECRGKAAGGSQLTGHGQAAEVVGVAAEHRPIPAAPEALAAAETLELVGMPQIGPAVQAAQQHLGRQGQLGTTWLGPGYPDAAGRPGTTALHCLHQQLQLLVLQLFEEGMRSWLECPKPVLGARHHAPLPPQPSHQARAP